MQLNNVVNLSSEHEAREWVNEVSRLFSNIKTNTDTLDFPSITANSYEDLTIEVTGAELNDAVILGLPVATDLLTFTAFISSADTATVRAINNTAGAIDPASATYRVTVIK